MLNKNDFETCKVYSSQNSNKTQENETITTQNRSEVPLTQMKAIQTDVIIAMRKYLIMSQQVNLRNDDIKNINIKARQEKRNEKGRSVTEVLGDSIVKKANSWESST